MSPRRVWWAPVARLAFVAGVSGLVAGAAALVLGPTVPQPASTAITLGLGVAAGWLAADKIERRRWRLVPALAVGVVCAFAWLAFSVLAAGD